MGGRRGERLNTCTDKGDKGVSKPSHRGRSLDRDEVDMRMRVVQVNAAHHVEKKATKHHRHSRPKKHGSARRHGPPSYPDSKVKGVPAFTVLQAVEAPDMASATEQK